MVDEREREREKGGGIGGRHGAARDGKKEKKNEVGRRERGVCGACVERVWSVYRDEARCSERYGISISKRQGAPF